MNLYICQMKPNECMLARYLFKKLRVQMVNSHKCTWLPSWNTLQSYRCSVHIILKLVKKHFFFFITFFKALMELILQRQQGTIMRHLVTFIISHTRCLSTEWNLQPALRIGMFLLFWGGSVAAQWRLSSRRCGHEPAVFPDYHFIWKSNWEVEAGSRSVNCERCLRHRLVHNFTVCFSLSLWSWNHDSPKMHANISAKRRRERPHG